MEPHWTDAAPSPVFTTVIRATGPDANLFRIVGAAIGMLEHLSVPRDRIEKLRADVEASDSYDAAIKLVERWFPVDRGSEG